jgi:hypothetical protein
MLMEHGTNPRVWTVWPSVTFSIGHWWWIAGAWLCFYVEVHRDYSKMDSQPL